MGKSSQLGRKGTHFLIKCFPYTEQVQKFLRENKKKSDNIWLFA